MNFKICFSRHLVLLEIISFERIFKTVAQPFAIRCEQSRYKVFFHLLLKRLLDSFLITRRKVIEWTWWAIVKGDHETTFIPLLKFFNTGFGNMTSTNTRVYKLIEVPLQLILNLFFYLHNVYIYGTLSSFFFITACLWKHVRILFWIFQPTHPSKRMKNGQNI